MLINSPFNYVLNSAKVINWPQLVDEKRLEDPDFLYNRIANLLKICDCKVGEAKHELITDKTIDLHAIFPIEEIIAKYNERVINLKRGDLLIISSDVVSDVVFNKEIKSLIIPIYNDGIFEACA